MAVDRAQATKINFVCRERYCRATFHVEPERVEPCPERPTHPWAYFATCRVCGKEATQAPWEIGLFNQAGKHTGPKTPEGIAAAAKNLEGHPTPEETMRTRFNAMKHGLFARTATYFPAKPGSYPHCDGCEYEIDQGCRAFGACVKRTELFMQHHIAFESKNPELLTTLNADTQAAAMAIVTDMARAILADGVRHITPKMYYDKEGACHVFNFVDKEGVEHTVNELTAHPLLKHFFEALSKNGLTLGDLGMTPRAQNEEELIRGHLAGSKTPAESVETYQRQISAQVGELRGFIERGRARLHNDPVLLEHQSGEE
jgi:hypothetical protein